MTIPMIQYGRKSMAEFMRTGVPRYARSMSDLTHIDDRGRATMVDVGAKDATERRAVARAVVRMSPKTAQAVSAGDAPKGDVLGTARLAGIMAAKRTDELIPLCHSLPLSFVGVEAEVGEAEVTLTAEARTRAQTGVEMEALTAASVAALTVYDMVKGLEKGVEIAEVVLLEKTGGKSGDWRRA
jgi:cyclic pyranopterin phosphate synthase